MARDSRAGMCVAVALERRSQVRLTRTRRTFLRVRKQSWSLCVRTPDEPARTAHAPGVGSAFIGRDALEQDAVGTEGKRTAERSGGQSCPGGGNVLQS